MTGLTRARLSHMMDDEIYINDGEYVLSSVVYGLSDIIEGGEYEIFVTE